MARTKGKPAGPEAATPSSIVATIEEDIVLGRLMPRERLIEEELMARFQATRHVVRQALVELERKNVIDRIPNRGALVRAYSAEDVAKLYEMRVLLEVHAAELMALPAPAETVAALRVIQARHDAAVEAGALSAVFRANLDFHQVLFAYAGNEYLLGAILDFANRTHVIRIFSLSEPRYLERSRAEHHAMIAALESGDRPALLGLCREHLVPSREAYLRIAPKRQT